MLDVVSNEIMRASDRYTIDKLGVSGMELMKRAATYIMHEVEMYDKIAIIAGKGNNGGDGICLAMLLIENGVYPDLYMFSRETHGESRYYYDMISGYDRIHIIDGTEDYSSYDVIVDCIFGTGLDREVGGIYATTIANINNSDTYVVCTDIPSGINGDSGAVMNTAVKADETLSIGTRKLGHYLRDAKDYVGVVKNGDIGISLVTKPYHLVEEKDIVLSRRMENSHKGTFGQISILGGSTRYLGAPKLATLGSNALMSGAGLVRLCIPREYVEVFACNILECTLYPLTSIDGMICYNESELLGLLSSSAIAIGVGIGDSAHNIDIVRYFVTHYTGKLLIDADGLNALSHDVSMLREHKADIVITPHVKEMSRLTGQSVDYILSHPLDVACEFANKYSVTVLLKGTSTIVTDGTDVYIVDRGSSCMAKGGSGDVLSGVIAGLLGNKELSTLEATYYGAYIAGMAGELSSAEYGTYGALASDTARNVSRVMASLERM